MCLRPGKSFIRKDNLVRANETLFGLSIDLDFFAAVVLLLRFEDYFTWPRAGPSSMFIHSLTEYKIVILGSFTAGLEFLIFFYSINKTLL